MKSHRQIFKSSAIIGGSTVLNTAIGILKSKVLAVLLGPAGIGLMGIYQNIMSIAGTMAGCGVGTSGVRQLAASAGDELSLAIVRRALWLGNLMLGLMGMAILWLVREHVAKLVFGNVNHANEVGWLGLGVLLSLIAGSQMALLQGLRRIGDLARVNVISALAGAAAGLTVIWLMGEKGILWFVLTAPAGSVIVATYYASRLPRLRAPQDWIAVRKHWLIMLKIGLPFMVAGLMTQATQLAARSMILSELGIEATGYFQAAWSVSMTYIGFVLGAMAADYYPRLTEAMKDHERANQLVNEQTEMAQLLAAPVLLTMITLAPLVVHLLYARSFAPATEILRWQVMGDIVKVMSWPMGFIVLAQGRGGIFIGTQSVWSATYLLFLWVELRKMGLVAVGIGFFVAYAVLAVVIYFVSTRLIGFRAMSGNWIFAAVLLMVGAGVLLLISVSPPLAYAFGLMATIAVTIYSLRRLDKLMDLSGWLKRKLGMS